MTGKTYRKQRKKSTYISKGTGFSHARSRKPPKQLTAKQKLYRETKNQVDLVNKRLRNLDKSGYTGTWASGKLLNRMNVKKLQGRKILTKQKGVPKIKVNKNLSTTNLIAIHQATRQFLESKTSTTRGINDSRKNVINSLQTTFSDMGNNISNEQAELLYSLFDNTDFEDISQYSNPSIVWTNVVDYIQKDTSEEELLDRLERYANVDINHDKDMREKVMKMIEYIKENR